MQEDLEKYNHLHQRSAKEKSSSGDDFVDFLYRYSELDIPDVDEKKSWDRLMSKMDSDSSTPSSGRNWLMVAASIALIFVFGSILYFNQPAQELISVHSGDERLEITFPDGSTGILNRHSSFSYTEDFGEGRKVVFQGEAYFDIVKSEKPFVIEMEGVNARVLGTAFNLNTHANQSIELYVDRGLVAFENETAYAEVSPGELASFSKESQSIHKSESVPANVLGWKNGIFVFDNISLKEALADLESYYHVQFQLGGKALSDCKISVTFDNKPLNEVLSTLEQLLDIRTTRKGDKVKISGQGC